MPARTRPAIVTLRMSSSLRDALHAAATAEQFVHRHEADDPAFFVEWARRRAS